MRINGIEIKNDCLHFRGDIPCKPHKNNGVHCESCTFYESKDSVVLIIKLGAIGDVIRTTPIIEKVKNEYPNSEIWWLTYTPDIVPNTVDKILNYSLESLTILRNTKYKLIINLDKDAQACTLASELKAEDKKGFLWANRRPVPADTASEHKYLTGLFDDVNQANTKSYPQEIFEICGWTFSGEEYVLDINNSFKWDIRAEGKRIVGLNTGCGSRWVSRLWKEEYWEELIVKLIKQGDYVLLLGGEQEDEKNERLAQKTGASYFGCFSLPKFVSLVNECDTVVTAVTMGLHIAVALKKYVVLMNNIFNPSEFELYGRGQIVQPEKKCTCFFSPECKNPDYFCLDSLTADMILNAVNRK